MGGGGGGTLSSLAVCWVHRTLKFCAQMREVIGVFLKHRKEIDEALLSQAPIKLKQPKEYITRGISLATIYGMIDEVLPVLNRAPPCAEPWSTMSTWSTR